jgi:hypothetical protein
MTHTWAAGMRDDWEMPELTGSNEGALGAQSQGDMTRMAPEVFDELLATSDIPDPSTELEALASLPRRIG